MLRKLILVLAVTGGMFLHAGDYISKSDILIGGELSMTSLDTSALDKGGIFDPAFRIGAQEGKYRIQLAYRKMADFDENGGTSKNRMFGAYLDYYLIDFRVATDFVLKPFLGVNVGYLQHQHENYEDKNSVTYGGSLGVVLDYTWFQADFGYRLMGADERKIDSLSNIFLGFNFKL